MMQVFSREEYLERVRKTQEKMNEWGIELLFYLTAGKHELFDRL